MGKHRATYEDFMDLQAAIVRASARAWREPSFQELCMNAPLEAIKEMFDGDFPFEHLSMTIKPSGPNNPHYFDPAHTGGWVGKNDVVTFYLPPPPEDQEQRAEALAAYNQAGPMGLQ